MSFTAFVPTIPAASAQQMLSGSASERADAIAQRCGGGRERHGIWLVHCPAHDDHTPSLSIKPVDDIVLVLCRAGCDTRAILRAIGLTWCDLFDDGRDPIPRPKRPTHRGAYIPEPPGDLTQTNIALRLALELLVDDIKLLEVEAVRTLLRQAATDPLVHLWINQQLRRYHLDPATVWRLVQAPTNTSTSRLRTIFIAPPQGVPTCQA